MALEEILAYRSRWYLCFALVAAAAAAAGCDRQPEAVIVPEFDLAYSFEAGLEGWTASASELAPGSWAAEGSTERATDGSRSARLSLTNPGGAGKVWLTRELELTPDKSYTAEVSFDLATSEHSGADAWKLILSARAEPPSSAASLDFQGDTSSGQAATTGIVWAEKRFTIPAQADAEGRLYLSVGIWGTTAGTRTYWLDNIRVVLTRTN